MKDSANREEERFARQRLLVRTSLIAEDQDLDQFPDQLRDAPFEKAGQALHRTNVSGCHLINSTG